MAMRRPVQPVPGCSWALFRRIATFGGLGGLPIMVLTLLTCQQASTFTLGWCAQGPQELNPHSARVGTGPPNRWLIPIKEEPPGGNSLGRFPVTRIRPYPGTSAMRSASDVRGWLCHPRDSFACVNIMSKG